MSLLVGGTERAIHGPVTHGRLESLRTHQPQRHVTVVSCCSLLLQQHMFPAVVSIHEGRHKITLYRKRDS